MNIPRAPVVAAATVAYMVVYLVGYPVVGPGLAALWVVPAGLVAWWYGTWPGIAAALAGYPLSTVVIGLALELDPQSAALTIGGPGSLAIVAMAAAIGTMRARTDRDRQALLEAGQRAAVLTALQDQGDQLMWAVDHDFRIIAANRAFHEASARWFRAEPRVGEVMVDTLPAGSRAKWVALYQRALGGEEFGQVITFRADDWEVVAELSFRPLLGEPDSPADVPQGGIIGVAVAGRDASMQRIMQAHLRSSARNSSLAGFVASVAHEINNTLASLRGNLDYLREQLPEGDPDLTEALSDSSAAVERVTATVHDLQVFALPDEGTPIPTDVNAALDKAMKVAWGQVKHRARMRRTYAKVPPVLADEANLMQAFGSLLANAAEAIPEGDAESHTIGVTSRVDDEGQVVVEISDTGSGIPEHLHEQVFRAFFTSKPVGQGPGLGLTVADEIVRSIGGRIAIESQPGRGTTVRVSLPAASVPLPRQSDDREPSEERVPPARILVIDDDPEIRLALQRLLHRHHVQLVGDAAEALARLRQRANYDLVLCDLMMPEMTGMDFFEAVATVQPGLERRIAFMTGGAFTNRARQFLARVGNPRFAKPFTAEAVESALLRLTGGGGQH